MPQVTERISPLVISAKVHEVSKLPSSIHSGICFSSVNSKHSGTRPFFPLTLKSKASVHCTICITCHHRQINTRNSEWKQGKQIMVNITYKLSPSRSRRKTTQIVLRKHLQRRRRAISFLGQAWRGHGMTGGRRKQIWAKEER